MREMRRPFLAFVILGKAAGLALIASGANAPLALTVFFAPGLLLLASLLVPGAPGVARVHTRFATNASEVWLTIDDGPDPVDTPRTLDLLSRHNARATFFLVGERAAAHPDLVRAIVEAGHEIGHHTHTHPAGTFWIAGPRRTARELDDALAAFATAGARPTRFRAPVGIKNLFLEPALEARGLRCIGWSLRSLDTLQRDPTALVARVRRRLQPGAIVLLHEGPRLAPAIRERGLAALLTALEEEGYRCVIPEPDLLRTQAGRKRDRERAEGTRGG